MCSIRNGAELYRKGDLQELGTSGLHMAADLLANMLHIFHKIQCTFVLPCLNFSIFVTVGHSEFMFLAAEM